MTKIGLKSWSILSRAAKRGLKRIETQALSSGYITKYSEWVWLQRRGHGETEVGMTTFLYSISVNILKKLSLNEIQMCKICFGNKGSIIAKFSHTVERQIRWSWMENGICLINLLQTSVLV